VYALCTLLIQRVLLLRLQVRVYLAKQCSSSEQQRYVQAVQTAFTRAVQARFGSSVHICCKGDDSSSSTARQQSWQQQLFGAHFAVQATSAPQSSVLQGGAAAAAGLVSWPQSPLRPQQQRRLQIVPLDEHMSEEGSEEDGDDRRTGDQSIANLQVDGLGAGKISTGGWVGR
jgi:hypothetical protein